MIKNEMQSIKKWNYENKSKFWHWYILQNCSLFLSKIHHFQEFNIFCSAGNEHHPDQVCGEKLDQKINIFFSKLQVFLIYRTHADIAYVTCN